MEPDEERDLHRLAEAVADGTDVDWAAAGSESRPQLAGLRAIAAISQWCHRVGGVEAAAAEGKWAETEGASARHAESEPTPRRWGPLVLHECVGSGSFADVYRATDPLLERDVALKLFKPERVPPERGWDSVLEEARRLAQVRHPNVILVHGADVHAGRAGLWTELLQGETLEQSLERRGPYSADEAALAGAELCAALAAIHAAGLVHGDVTTRNAMRVDGGRIVLMDFGSAHEAVEEPTAWRTGTPLTLAPEVLAGAPPSRAADVYQLGVVLYRLTSRVYPVDAASMDDLVTSSARNGSKRLRDRRADLPAAFVQVVECALEAEPSRRFASMGEMERALRATLGARPRPRRRRPLALAALAVVLAAGGLVGARWSRGGFLNAPPRVEASLFRVHAGTPEPIDARARLQPGDALFMTVESREDLHLYVFNEATSEQGTLNPLFPDPGLRLQNPLSGGIAHRLPSSSAGEAFWQASPTGGTERILVVATRSRFEALEELAAAPHPPATQVDPRAVEAMRLRAIRLYQPPAATGSAIDALVPQLETRRRQGKDIWYELIQIEPEPAGNAPHVP